MLAWDELVDQRPGWYDLSSERCYVLLSLSQNVAVIQFTKVGVMGVGQGRGRARGRGWG